MNATKSFYEQLADEIGDPVPFQPIACYNRDGDCVEFHLSKDNYYAKRLDGWVTVYLSEATGDIAGGVIKGVRSSLLRRFPGIQFQFHDGSVNLAVLLKAPSFEAGSQVIHKIYADIIQKASDLEVNDLEPVS